MFCSPLPGFARPRRALEPSHPLERAALVGARSRRGNPYLQRDRIRTAQRLAAGMTAAEVARAEGMEPAAVDELLAQGGFRALVESQKALAERPAAEQTERLVKLARQAIENALSDWDMGAAFFVLREHSQGRDPACTVARRVLSNARRTPAAPTPPRPAAPPAAPRLHDPLDALVHRRTAALRRAVAAEHAARHGVAEPAAPLGGATRAAAERALALKRREPAATGAPPVSAGLPPAPPRPAAMPAPTAAVPLAALPRRPRAP